MPKPEQSFVRSIAFLLAIAMTFGCDSKERLPAAPADGASTVSITNIAPAVPGQALQAA
jgi:hypothetical protein